MDDVKMNLEKDLEHYMMIVESIPSTHPNLQDFEEEAIHEVLGALRSRKTKVLMAAKIHIDDNDILKNLKKQMEFANLGIIVPNETLIPLPTWIPVSERLPEEFADVLCNTDSGEIFIASYLGKMNDGTNCFDDDGGSGWLGNVIAWMPLPEPFKAESEEEESGTKETD